MTLLKAVGGLISDSVARHLRVDPSTNSLQTVDYPHHEIHGGSAFLMSTAFDLAINNVLDIQLTTPNTTKWTHMQLFFSTEAETNFWLWENVTINTAGTDFAPRNRNRNSATAATLVTKYITNTSLALANADTAVAGATALVYGIAGAGRNGQGEGQGRHEFILKQNEDYSLRFEAVAAGYVTFVLDWYEHTDKD